MQWRSDVPCGLPDWDDATTRANEAVRKAERDYLIHGHRKPCLRCEGTGWLEPIGPKSDGSYITSRPCPNCHGDGRQR